MIIYGSRGIERTVESGTFHCARCGPNRPYQHREIRRWFTLYFIPVFPMYRAGEYLECGSCSATFGVEAKYGQPTQVASAMGVAASPSIADGPIPFDDFEPTPVVQPNSREGLIETSRKLFVLTLAALPRPNEGHMNALCTEFHALVGTPISPAEVNAEWQRVVEQGQKVVPFTKQVARSFTPQQHAVLLQAIARMIAGGQYVTTEERQLATSIGAAFGLSPVMIDQAVSGSLGR